MIHLVRSPRAAPASANADFFTGSDAGRSFFNPAGNSLTFGGVATTRLFNIPLGASVRISGAMTLIGDPASIDIIDCPVELYPPDANVGMGEASNVGTFVPEPGVGVAARGEGAVLIGRIRRRR